MIDHELNSDRSLGRCQAIKEDEKQCQCPGWMFIPNDDLPDVGTCECRHQLAIHHPEDDMPCMVDGCICDEYSSLMPIPDNKMHPDTMCGNCNCRLIMHYDENEPDKPIATKSCSNFIPKTL